MKDNNSNNIGNQDNYSDGSNDLEYNNNNNFIQNNKKDDSLDKYFKQMDDNHESDDILKQLEYLNLSEEKSFEMPKKIFDPLLDKNKDNININTSNKKEKKENKKINNDEELYDINNIENNNKEKYSKYNIDSLTEIKNENDNNEGKKQVFEEKNSNGEDNEKLSEILLKEKLNRICASIHGYTLNQKCYQNLNNFIQFLPEVPQNLYQPIDLLFDVFIELLMRIKQEFKVKENLILKLNTISLNNEGYEKKLLKLNKDLKEKEKEIGALINKVNYEKEKTKDNSKSKILEINSLKKENQQLNNKLTLYKNQIRKSEADYKAIQNKLRYYIFERENKNNLSTNINDKNNINNNKEKNNQEEFKINNDKYLAIKKLNMSLVYLLKDINKNICKYDFSLNKIINSENQRNNNYEIDDLNNNIETNLLIDEKNFKNLSKNFMFNMDIINNKIIDILKQKTNIIDIDNPKIYNTKNISNINNNYRNNRKEGNYRTDKSFDNISNNIRDQLNEDNYISNKNMMKENYINKKNIKNNEQKSQNINNSSNNFNNKNIQKNNNNQGFNFNKIGKNNNNTINTKYDYHTRNFDNNNSNNNNSNNNSNNNNNSNKNDRKKNSLNFLNFYNNDDKDLEDNIETRAAINPKWYDNCKNKKIGYVFDKTKLFTCNDEDDRTNGANDE